MAKRKKLLNKLLTSFLLATLMFVWYSGAFLTQVYAVSLPATSYFSSASSAVITGGGADQIVTTAPAAASIATSCKNAKTTGYCQETPGVANTVNGQVAPTAPNGKGWIYDTALNSTIPTGTWTFNMRTTSSSATGTGFITVCAWKVKVTAGAISSSTAIFACTDGSTNVQSSTTQLTSTVSVAGVAATSFATTEYLYVEFWLHTTVSGGSTTGKVSFESNAGAADDLVSPNASSNLAPSVPSQDSPLNSATGVSTTPTFLMTATDPELNGLGYKVTIYSNNLCTTVVQTNDQSVSSVGWTATNATCTGAPTTCYASGTQGSYLTQTALSASTQYWWKASAKDPDGSNTFTDSSTCNTFTTGASNPTFTQNKYRWYVDNNLADPTTAWGNPAIAENTAIAVVPAMNNPPDLTTALRLRVNYSVATANLAISSAYFKLEYKAGTDGSCTTGTWTDVGTGAWAFATSTVTDGSNINAVLSDTTTGLGEQYSKGKPTALNHVAAVVGNIIEYDFHIVGTTAVNNTTYSFRVVGTNSTGTTETVFTAYTNCPTLTTRPGTGDIMKHGDVFTNGSEQGFFWAQ